MAFSSGTFSLYATGNPVVTGTVISSSWANNTLTDIATGLSTCLLKDGTQTVTANIPFAGFRLTGIGAPTTANDALREGSAIGAVSAAAVTGTTITATTQLTGKGTATNDSPTAGYIGEVLSGTLATASAIGLTSDTPADITTVSLTAGDWDVSVSAYVKGNAATTVSYAIACISAVSATLNETNGNVGCRVPAAATVFASASYLSIETGTIRLSLAATTTYYLVMQAGFGVNTLSAYGKIYARRSR